MSTIEERISRLEVDMNEIKEILRATAIQQQVNTQAIATLQVAIADTRAIADTNARTIEALGQRIDSYIREAERVRLTLTEQSQRSAAILESLVPFVQKLTTRTDEDRSEFRTNQANVQSMISRLDALVSYLMRGDRPQP